MFPPEVKSVLQRLGDAGYEAYAVGGCVRDILLGKEPGDYDLATSALPEQTMELFSGYSVPTGLRHGTVTVRAGQRSVEVTTFRTEHGYQDHRHPDCVRFTHRLEEDLGRRDFTINAMAMDTEGRLTDLFGGREDLRRGVIRAVGDPEKRFEEDALRILRALRFASVLGFSIEETTAAAIETKREGLRYIAAERIHTEMTKLLCGEKAGEVLLRRPEVWGIFMPEILPCVGFDQCTRYHCYDVWEHTARTVNAAPPEPILRWTMLLHDLAKPLTFTRDESGSGHFYGHARRGAELAGKILQRLRFDRRSAERIRELVLRHDRQIVPTEKSVTHCLNTMGEEMFRQLLEVKRADNLAQHPAYRGRQKEIDRLEEILSSVLAEKPCFTLRQMAVNGGDMMALGLQGRAVGEMLRWLLEQVLDGTLDNDREVLLLSARKRQEEARKM